MSGNVVLRWEHPGNKLSKNLVIADMVLDTQCITAIQPIVTSDKDSLHRQPKLESLRNCRKMKL